ncbi:hypothetical protein V6L77_18355 [Pannonibacter sp. Pt2-lr]
MTALKTIAIGTIAAALATSVAGIALAESFGPKGWGGMDREGGRHGGRMIEMFDQNKDGAVTQDEASAVVVERFAAADADKDGRVTLDEFKAYRLTEMQPMKVRAFQRLDRDGDGKVTRAEFDRISDRMFARLDRDGDGELKAMPVPPRGPEAVAPRLVVQKARALKGKALKGKAERTGRWAAAPRVRMAVTA